MNFALLTEKQKLDLEKTINMYTDTLEHRAMIADLMQDLGYALLGDYDHEKGKVARWYLFPIGGKDE